MASAGDDRSRSRERRERDQKELERKETPVTDLTDLFTRLEARAEKRKTQSKEDIAGLVENNDGKWKQRLEEDRKELLRIQDEKTDMKLKQAEAKTNAEFEKIRKEIVDFTKERNNLNASEDYTTLLFGGLHDMTFEAADKWVKDQIKDKQLEEPSLVYFPLRRLRKMSQEGFPLPN